MLNQVFTNLDELPPNTNQPVYSPNNAVDLDERYYKKESALAKTNEIIYETFRRRRLETKSLNCFLFFISILLAVAMILIISFANNAIINYV